VTSVAQQMQKKQRAAKTDPLEARRALRQQKQRLAAGLSAASLNTYQQSPQTA
jgi:phenylpyruvate tautomerase PptA (4-oxalocrotonate tautomerase family)